MTSNYLVNVPKLKGRENYGEWVFAAENFLVLEDMLHCIKTIPGKILETADDTKTKAKLIMTIDSALYVHIKDVNTTLQLWNKLKTLFDDSGFTRRISLLRNLISIRQENCVSMQSYVTQLVETGQKLSGTGFNISDEWIGCLMLAGLSEKFMPMIMAIEHSGIKITTDAIRTKLMDMETDVSANVRRRSNYTTQSLSPLSGLKHPLEE
uniref:SFRICE_016825 n=1 Tax=Spodoptera frugiperda TaxID=7108 RepID=A0A2H1WQ59_SPOFR